MISYCGGYRPNTFGPSQKRDLLPSALPEPKAAYTLAELASMSGRTSRQLARWIEARGVPRFKIGGGLERSRYAIPLSGFRRAFPDLWESIEIRLRHSGEALPETVTCEVCGHEVDFSTIQR